VIRDAPAQESAGGQLADALANAVVLADSHGDDAQAYKILAGALLRVADPERVELAEQDREAVAQALDAADELAGSLPA